VGVSANHSRRILMLHFRLASLSQQRAQTGDLYHEFVHVPAMSAGLYELTVGADDPQEPHTEDEMYYVVAGRASLLVDTEDVAVEAGSLVYVPAQVAHRFHNITEALSVLVFFAPAEYSQRAAEAVG
jgi:mannose-6-phosphate isomerase-like protein (cupin superfamily)